MQNGFFGFLNTSRKVASTAFHTFVVDVAREGTIDFRPFHPVLRVILAVIFALMGLFLLGVFFGDAIRIQFPAVVLVNDSSPTRTYTIASPYIPLTLFALTVGWGAILSGALYARPFFRWLVLTAYFIFFAATLVTFNLSFLTITGMLGSILLATTLIICMLILGTFLLFPRLPLPRLLAWGWLFALNGVLPVSLYLGGIQIELLFEDAFIANMLSSLMTNHYMVSTAFLLISGLGWIDFALQTSKWSTDAVQQHASRLVVVIFLLGLLGLRGVGMMRNLAQSGFDGNAVIGACILIGGLALIGLLRQRLTAPGPVPISFLMWLAVLLPIGQYLVFLINQVGFVFIVAQIMRAEAQSWTDALVEWTLRLSEWEIQVRALGIAVVGIIVTFIAQRRGNGTLATFGLVLAWTRLIAWLTEYGRPLGAYRFDYAEVDLVMMAVVLVLVLVWVFTNQLTRARALHLFAIVALLALLNQTDFLDNPFSPFFGFAGVAFLVFGIFWNLIDLAGLFVNQETPGLSRESRALMYGGYALLTVAVSHWFLVSHNTIFQELQVGLTFSAFEVVGYPLAYTIVLEGGRSLVPSAPEPTPVEAISIEPMTT